MIYEISVLKITKGIKIYVRKTSGMSALQSLELQRILQSETVRVCEERQDLPEKEETENKIKSKGERRGVDFSNRDGAPCPNVRRSPRYP